MYGSSSRCRDEIREKHPHCIPIGQKLFGLLKVLVWIEEQEFIHRGQPVFFTECTRIAMSVENMAQLMKHGKLKLNRKEGVAQRSND